MEKESRQLLLPRKTMLTEDQLVTVRKLTVGKLAKKILADTTESARLSLHCNPLSLGYANQVLRLNSFEELRELFTNSHDPVKEITESFACLQHLKNFCNVSEYTVIHVGDGSWCRTGAIFAYHTKSTNVCIDPDANKTGRLTKWVEKWNTQRLTFYSCKVADCEYQPTGPYILTNVHSHAPMSEVLAKYPNAEYIYCNPCCIRRSQILTKDLVSEYRYELIHHEYDSRILSALNEVLIYRKLR